VGSLMMIGTAVAGILLAAIASQLASEFRDWTPHWTDWLVDRAARRLPPDLQERMAEEWREFVSDTPGHLAKLGRAAGLSLAARRVSLEVSGLSLLEHVGVRAVIVATIVFYGPLMVLVAVLLKLRGGRPILEEFGKQKFYRFRTGDDAVGRLIRRVYLDELPALLNYARGDAILRWSKILAALKRVLFR
jgi:hypothetical protein